MRTLRTLLLQYGVPIIAFVLFIALCSYRLQDLYVFNADPARDTLQSVRLLRSKDITFIGPPLSLGLNGMRETYFSSAIYYVGALGLALSKLSVLGPVMLIALVNATAIFPLYSLLKKQTKQVSAHMLGIALYVSNPIVVTYSRVFWNPSPLIGLSIWSIWALGRSPWLFGLIVAGAVYFHYFAATLLVLGVVYYLQKGSRKAAFQSVLACLGGLAPFLFFEMRNEFYLTQSFIYNLSRGGGGVSTHMLLQKGAYFLEMPVAIVGLLQDQFATRLISVESIAVYLGLFAWSGFMYFQRKSIFTWFIVLCAAITALASQDYIHIQYFFPAVGALWMFGQPSKGKQTILNNRLCMLLLVLILALQSVNTLYVLTAQKALPKGTAFPALHELEAMTQHIKTTHTEGARVNITENVYRDARALYMRFFLEREQLSGLQSELQYADLDELYVVTPSIDKTLQENRWEFTASGDKELVNSTKVGEWYVLKFERTVPK